MPHRLRSPKHAEITQAEITVKLSVDLIIYELEEEKLQTVLKGATLHYEEKLVDQINVNDE